MSKLGLWSPGGLSPVRIILAIVDIGELVLDWDLECEGVPGFEWKGVPGLEWNGVPMERDCEGELVLVECPSLLGVQDPVRVEEAPDLWLLGVPETSGVSAAR